MAMITVIPDSGNMPAIARRLLLAADEPRQVQMVTHPQAGFIVPQEVFDRFKAQEEEPEPRAAAKGEDEKPAPRKRGRPRKNQE